VEPESAGERWSITLSVKMKDGREFTESGTFNRDWTQRPTPMDTILKKFWHQVEFSQTVSRQNAEKIIDLCQNLEKVDDMSRITGLLVA
jgi:hypothetical protein